VTARQINNEIQYATQLNAFVSIPYAKMTEKALQKEGIPFAVDGDQILVHGNESERFADLLDKDIRRTMARGMLNPEEPDSVRLIRQITQSLVGKAEKGQTIYFSVPAPLIGEEGNLTYHEATLRQVLIDLGFQVKSVNEGLAVVYAELESSNYTGIGISCGGGLCNVCFSYLSVPIVSFSIPKAGDFIDASSASVTGERPNRIRMLKEQSFFLNGHFDNKLQQVLSVYYDDMIQTVVTELKRTFQGTRNLPKLARPIPLVLSGGSAMPKGFRDRFEMVLRASDFPVELSEIRTAADPLTTTAKGALIGGLSEM
jgi:hypothetical protein